jgi:hypothetical protein
MLSNKLIDELGLLRLRHKRTPVLDAVVTQTADSPPEKVAKEIPQTAKLDKHEFRLLVKMLQAIDHDCQYDHMQYDGTVVKYQLPSITLVFGDINLPDSEETINLASLADIIANPSLKRPVWEKLKQLK